MCQIGISCVWTGDGYVIDKHAIQYSGVSDASVFFNRLAKQPYLSQFLVAPHIYCGEVTGATYGTSGSVLYQKLTTTFGYLTLQGRPCNLLLLKQELRDLMNSHLKLTCTSTVPTIWLAEKPPGTQKTCARKPR